jgi:hypothetical protein
VSARFRLRRISLRHISLRHISLRHTFVQSFCLEAAKIFQKSTHGDGGPLNGTP